MVGVHSDNSTLEEWKDMAGLIKKKYPLSRGYLGQLHEVFEEFDKDHDQHLSLNELAEMFLTISKKVTALPATAQVASQEGAYLAKMFNKLATEHKALQENGILDLDDDVYFHPFKYHSLGNLAYIGNSAAFDLNGYSSVGGLLAMYAWRSVYWSEQVSMRTRFMLMLDWVKRGLFGRDLSKVSAEVALLTRVLIRTLYRIECWYGVGTVWMCDCLMPLSMSLFLSSSLACPASQPRHNGLQPLLDLVTYVRERCLKDASIGMNAEHVV